MALFSTSFSLTVIAENLPACTKHLNYSLHLSGIHTGFISQTQQWNDNQVLSKNKGRASILGIGSSYTQSSEMYFENGQWLTQSFHQTVTGFRKRDMQVFFPESENASSVALNGKEYRYESEAEPLRDIDTMAMQIRQNLLDGKNTFSLARQASDGVELYQYEVLEAQAKSYERWGRLKTIPVTQSGAEKVTYYYSPGLDYQIIEARYHGWLLNGRAELVDFTSSCN
ncbi:hypothetical protein [uncultured Vibrio sp.]|uniref:hypothetical protein n=1 Tax=uncultured Vibrio sp. TaxID=114054 RepID=UPI0009249EB5|nr:hypothetical protein [uncultured Vibrio sp.]OIQ25380.1 MAG: hypothetical protein BM561_06345 [Vibrio sp. MedPE-SWchi]